MTLALNQLYNTEVNSITIGAPFSANKMYAPSQRFGMVKTQKYRKWIEFNLPKMSGLSKPASFPIKIYIQVFSGVGFTEHSDIDNIIKPITDLLVRAEILPDDNIKYVHKSEVAFMDFWSKKGEATTVITLIEL